MTTRTERDAAIDTVSYVFIAKLSEWIDNERLNLVDYINNPDGHVMNNPYIVPDWSGLTDRSKTLGAIADNLDIVVAFKQGNPNVTRGMHDTALDAVPHLAYDRLIEWLTRMLRNMRESLDLPLSDYDSLVSFDVQKFTDDINAMDTSLAGIQVVREFALEELLANQPTPEAQAAVMAMKAL